MARGELVAKEAWRGHYGEWLAAKEAGHDNTNS